MTEPTVAISRDVATYITRFILEKSDIGAIRDLTFTNIALDELDDPVGELVVKAAHAMRNGNPQNSRDITITVKPWAIGAALIALHDQCSHTKVDGTQHVLKRAYDNIAGAIRYESKLSHKGDEQK